MHSRGGAELAVGGSFVVHAQGAVGRVKGGVSSESTFSFFFFLFGFRVL